MSHLKAEMWGSFVVEGYLYMQSNSILKSTRGLQPLSKAALKPVKYEVHLTHSPFLVVGDELTFAWPEPSAFRGALAATTGIRKE